MAKDAQDVHNNAYYTWDVEKTLQHFHSSKQGLTDEQVERNRSIYGVNKLIEGKKRSLISMFLDQLKNVMILILIIAALISGFTYEMTDAIIILVVVLLNAVLGVIQESRAEKAIDALNKMSSPMAKIVRNGQIQQIKSEDLVPGDLVILEAGDRVPADLRLIQVSSLQIEESALTGESLPVEKKPEPLYDASLVVGDRINMAFSGSNVTYGRGMGIVTAVGMETEVGKIAAHLANQHSEQTPLQKKIAGLSKYLTIGILTIAAVMFTVGIMQGREIVDMLLLSITLAVAAIPEGLPAVITIVLTIGVQRMAKKNAIIRRLSAVETLGSTNIICSDKTGTLTQNRMTVKQIYVDGAMLSLDAARFQDNSSLQLMARALILCNDSKEDHENDTKSFIGDPTETALADFALSLGIRKGQADELYPRINEIPFDSERKLMTTIHADKGKYLVVTKGAPDLLLDRCTSIFQRGEHLPLRNEDRTAIQQANKKMADQALRVLGVAYKLLEDQPHLVTSETIEKDLVFIGLVGMIDPPREEVKAAIQKCIDAGVKTIMITGDHKDTAVAIAKELKILNHDEEAVVGSQLMHLTDAELAKNIEKYSVFARVSPEHKVRIVNAWKKKGKIIAMTGDGVNDAPALKAADIGVGMGITGTDVAKGAADMVLADDNFATIVSAVEEGRKIYTNIRKAIQFLFSSNLGEILTLFVGTLLGWTVLYPIHILWINLITDTLPALSLGLEKAEKDVMQRKPKHFQGGIFSGGIGLSILYQGILQSAITLLVYLIGYHFYSQEVAITMAFATLGLIQLVHVFNVRSTRQSIKDIGLFSNLYLIGAVLISAAMQLSVILVPFLQTFFRVVPLNLIQWLIVLISALSIIPIVELIKGISRTLSYRAAK